MHPSPDWSVHVPGFGTVTVTSSVVASCQDGRFQFYGGSSRVRAQSRGAVSMHLRRACSNLAGVSPLVPPGFWVEVYDRAVQALAVRHVLSE